MSAAERRISAAMVAERLRSEGDRVGVFEEVLGMNTATTGIKSVHLMNDLAQQLVGGAPDHRGDYLCRVIRFDKDGSEPKAAQEDNTDAVMRADATYGRDYERAFPPSLGVERTRAVREAARLLLNFDGGMYRAGDNMASGLATHWTLLGFEGFSRFGLGAAFASAMGEEGRALGRELYRSAGDPVSRALEPLMLERPLVERPSGRGQLCLRDFDHQYGAAVTNLLRHSLSKPAKLRALAHAGVLWAVLRVLGAGRAHGRPILLAIPSQWKLLKCNLREPAVQSFSLGVRSLDDAVALALTQDEAFLSAASGPDAGDTDSILVSGEDAAREALAVLRDTRAVKVYWPDAFASALGRKVGCVGPSSDRAGWGKYLCLTPDLLETISLMFLDPGGDPTTWRALWTRVREEIGVVIGANPYLDEAFLRGGGLLHVDLGDLEHNADLFFRQACDRGVARRLPDGESEVGMRII
jgi:hypothetical protein